MVALALTLAPLLLSLPLALANPVPSSSSSSAAPGPTAPALTPRGIGMPLTHGAGYVKRVKAQQAAAKRDAAGKAGVAARADEATEEEEGLPASWLLWAGARVDTKYNSGLGGFAAAYAKELTKRANGEITLTNHNLDTSYSASLSVGTPAQTLEIVLDTGSSDLWVASDACQTTACSSMDQYDHKTSTTSLNMTTSFAIEYGSGTASGSLFQDLVTLGGYSVASQTFAACDVVSTGLLSSGVSGIMGLSWQALAYSKATPWWITLAKSTSWSDPLFAFYLSRYRNVAGASATETDGGYATFGYLDSSLYSGDITYVSVGSSPQYWQIEMDSATMQGSAISLGSSNMVAIDTGTTLIGGPESIVASIYAKIPGSSRMTGSYSSYYQYPCNTSVDFEVTFGGFTITITDQDFNLGKYSSDTSMCTGAVYVQALSSSSPVQWIVGDAALKNTYTVFRYSPAAVGFANLAESVTSSEAAQSTTIVDASSLLAAASSTAASSKASTSASASSAGASATGSASASAGASSEAPHVVVISASSTSTVGTESAAASGTGSASAAGASESASSGAGRVAVPALGAVLLGVLGALVL
ncbi:hypothetical protein IAT38_005465 [Cryptococcus sp. DSM 104549]